MSDLVEHVALAIFLSRYPDSQEFWPDRLDELVNGPPFEADGYRLMARAAIEAVRVHLLEQALAGKYSEDKHALYCAAEELEEALGKVNA